MAAGMVAVVVLAAAMVPLVSPEAEGARQKFKVLHIMSYHSPWEWAGIELVSWDVIGTFDEYPC